MDELKEMVGVDHILFGSDFPHPEGIDTPLRYLDALENFSEEETKKVMGANLKGLIDRVQN